ncbi:MAG: cyclic nucleotide-binding domain-containing protein [Arcobacteraceae bacterium]|nr:cyclic nucleotide-binding domain-containing protein [Arcobacteraceae bacterium]
MSLDNFINRLIDENYRTSFSDIIKEILLEKEKITFFKDLEDDEIKLLLENVILKRFLPNEIIFSQGEDKDDYMYYIVNGSVKVMNKSKNGLLRKIITLHKSTLLGEMKPILKEGRTATCIAGVDGAIAIGFTIKEDIKQPAKVYEKFYKNVSKILIQKLQEENIEFTIEKNNTSDTKSAIQYYKDISFILAKKLQDNNKNLY